MAPWVPSSPSVQLDPSTLSDLWVPWVLSVPLDLWVQSVSHSLGVQLDRQHPSALWLLWLLCSSQSHLVPEVPSVPSDLCFQLSPADPQLHSLQSLLLRPSVPSVPSDPLRLCSLQCLGHPSVP